MLRSFRCKRTAVASETLGTRSRCQHKGSSGNCSADHTASTVIPMTFNGASFETVQRHPWPSTPNYQGRLSFFIMINSCVHCFYWVTVVAVSAVSPEPQGLSTFDLRASHHLRGRGAVRKTVAPDPWSSVKRAREVCDGRPLSTGRVASILKRVLRSWILPRAAAGFSIWDPVGPFRGLTARLATAIERTRT